MNIWVPCRFPIPQEGVGLDLVIVSDSFVAKEQNINRPLKIVLGKSLAGLGLIRLGKTSITVSFDWHFLSCTWRLLSAKSVNTPRDIYIHACNSAPI